MKSQNSRIGKTKEERRRRPKNKNPKQQRRVPSSFRQPELKGGGRVVALQGRMLKKPTLTSADVSRSFFHPENKKKPSTGYTAAGHGGCRLRRTWSRKENCVNVSTPSLPLAIEMDRIFSCWDDLCADVSLSAFRSEELGGGGGKAKELNGNAGRLPDVQLWRCWMLSAWSHTDRPYLYLVFPKPSNNVQCGVSKAMNFFPSEPYRTNCNICMVRLLTEFCLTQFA